MATMKKLLSIKIYKMEEYMPLTNFFFRMAECQTVENHALLFLL